MANAERNLYDVLGVDRRAEPDAIKRAFRDQARTLHPDVSGDPDAAERFSELSRAYGVLSKPAKRILYDRLGYLGHGNGGFEERERSDRPSTVHLAEVTITKLEAERGATKRARVTSLGTCGSCGGTGAEPHSVVETCIACDGEGRLRQTSYVGDAEVLRIEACSACEGRGRVVTQPCTQCDGEGSTRAERTVSVEIRPGVADGSLVRAEGTDVHVLVKVLAERDAGLVRYAAAVALVLALALFVILAIAPDSLSL